MIHICSNAISKSLSKMDALHRFGKLVQYVIYPLTSYPACDNQVRMVDKSSQSILQILMEGCVLTMVISRQHRWDLIPASVPWRLPDQRTSTDHCVVTVALRSASSLTPNIHVTFAELKVERFLSFILSTSQLMILTLNVCLDFALLRKTEETNSQYANTVNAQSNVLKRKK